MNEANRHMDKMSYKCIQTYEQLYSKLYINMYVNTVIKDNNVKYNSLC